MNLPVTTPVSGTKYRTFSVRLPPHIIDKLHDSCRKNGTVPSKVVRRLIASGLGISISDFNIHDSELSQ
jgi:hypothetical protein